MHWGFFFYHVLIGWFFGPPADSRSKKPDNLYFAHLDSNEVLSKATTGKSKKEECDKKHFEKAIYEKQQIN